MRGGFERLSCYKQTKSFKALQAQRLGGFFIRHTKKEVDKAHTTLYNSRASKERRR